MKIGNTAILISFLAISLNSYSLTCPDKIQFTCVQASADKCTDLENPTICTVAGLGQTWEFLAPNRHIEKNVNILSTLPGKSSCSILPERSYSAGYGFSYYGQVTDGEGGSFTAAYCLYVTDEGNLAGLISKDYAYDPRQDNWSKTDEGWVCQDPKNCNFVKLLSRG